MNRLARGMLVASVAIATTVSVSVIPQAAIAVAPDEPPSAIVTSSLTLTGPSRALTVASLQVGGEVTLGDAPGCTGSDRRSFYRIYIELGLNRNNWDAFTPWGSAGTHFISSKAIEVGPGNYAIKMRYQCRDAQNRVLEEGQIESPSLPSVTIASVASYEVITAPWGKGAGPGGSDVELWRNNPPAILTGTSVGFPAYAETTWSDGVVTYENPCGPPFDWRCDSSAKLWFRPVGSATWTAIGGALNELVELTAPGDYRLVFGTQTTRSCYINVIRPTSANRVSGVSVSPVSAVANVPLVFSGVLETQYDDEVWRPAPVGTAFELQFLAEGGTGWSRLVTERVSQAGVVSVRWPMLGSGRFRIVAGAATSESVAVTEVKPTSVVAADPLNLPSEVFPGDPVDISVGVDVQFSDGVYRDAPDGTPFAVEFAESFDPDAAGRAVPRSGLTWKTQATGVTKSGKADAQVSPKTSGFWRMAFGQNRTSPVFVEVVGSKPQAPQPVSLRVSGSPSSSEVSWVFTPVSGVTYEASASTRSGRIDSSQVSLEQSGRVTVSGLPAKTAVTVLVTGTDSFGQTDGGATATATTAGSTPQPGAAPGPVSAINVSAPSRGRVTVTWSAPSSGGEPASYQYRTRAGKWSPWRSVTVPRVTITMPTKNRPTTIQIRAVNSTGRGPTQQALL